MSGGSMNYLFTLVNDAADNIIDGSPERAAFALHLLDVADALHDIEWVDSGDYGYGQEIPAIMKCITKDDVISAAKMKVDEAIKEFNRVVTGE